MERLAIAFGVLCFGCIGNAHRRGEKKEKAKENFNIAIFFIGSDFINR